MNRTIKVAIVGCGNIAGGYDEQKKGDGIFSHAGAYRLYPTINIAAVYDPDRSRMKEFCEYWSVSRSCNDLDELLDDKYDVISICTPDETHQEILEKIMERGSTSYIWTEKPLTVSVGGAVKVIQKAKNKNIGLWLSNQRRWEPGHLMVRKKIRDGEIGDIIHVTGYYVKGITHIGCTLIDTLRFLCGEVVWTMSIPPFRIGSYGHDYSLRGNLGFDRGGTASIIGCDINQYVYSIFELDLIGTKGRIRIEENGERILIYDIKEYKHYSGFQGLNLREEIESEAKWAMKYCLDSFLKEYYEGVRLTYTAEEGLRDLQVIEALKQSAEKDGIRILLQ